MVRLDFDRTTSGKVSKRFISTGAKAVNGRPACQQDEKSYPAKKSQHLCKEMDEVEKNR
ncbi:MAG: hypothetical protein KatS3mg030_621 [Saprospiraceae bacterium]|nr:MAG: hypothetical protein KatS3mg029_0479 [Saprospiraceae bacterium]GIV32319.1 MAG: hypothetical protein KatS3mg030_621 [Saprospiraceae bacterium]